MTGIPPAAGGRITGVVPIPDIGGTMTPRSGTGRPPLTWVSSLFGTGMTDPSLPCGMVGELLRGLTASGTTPPGDCGTPPCPQLGTAAINPPATSTQPHQCTGRC